MKCRLWLVFVYSLVKKDDNLTTRRTIAISSFVIGALCVAVAFTEKNYSILIIAMVVFGESLLTTKSITK